MAAPRSPLSPSAKPTPGTAAQPCSRVPWAQWWQRGLARRGPEHGGFPSPGRVTQDPQRGLGGGEGRPLPVGVSQCPTGVRPKPKVWHFLHTRRHAQVHSPGALTKQCAHGHHGVPGPPFPPAGGTPERRSQKDRRATPGLTLLGRQPSVLHAVHIQPANAVVVLGGQKKPWEHETEGTRR